MRRGTRGWVRIRLTSSTTLPSRSERAKVVRELVERVIVQDVVKIRRDAPIEMLGPLGCGLQTGAGAVLNVMQPSAGQSIAVYGVGGVGLAGLMAARIAGCDPIVAVDRLANRL